MFKRPINDIVCSTKLFQFAYLVGHLPSQICFSFLHILMKNCCLHSFFDNKQIKLELDKSLCKILNNTKFGFPL